MSTLASPPFQPLSFASSPGSMGSPNGSRSTSVLPLQQMVSSASQLPSRSNSNTIANYTSNQYIEQHRKFMEHQRQLHEEERSLWHLERDELHQRIHELEDTVRKLGGHAKSTFGPQSQNPSSVPGQTSVPGVKLASISYAAPFAGNGTGDEFWRGPGGKSDAHPTRSFSESSDPTRVPTVVNHLAPISEDAPRKKSVGFAGVAPNLESPPVRDFFTHPIPGHPSNAQGISSIPGDRISASLDGISFKSSSTVAKAISSSSATPSPLGTPASHGVASSTSTSAPPSAHPKPVFLNLPEAGLTTEELLKKDAGHTPLARLAETESNTSSQDTPVGKPSETQQSNEVARQSKLRQPIERSDSYFPVVVEEEAVHDTEEDPALKGPLGLKGDPTSKENDMFLTSLDSKLLQAQQRSNSLDTASETGSAVDTDLRKVRSAEGDRPVSRDGPGIDSEEPEIKLKMKRSTNFGTRFGASTFGTGF